MSGWIDIEDSLPQHRKTLEVADDLDIEPVQLVGHLTCFWLWAINNADNDGLLAEGTTAETIARAAFWIGDPQAFVYALNSRFLEFDNGRVRIHGWGEHYGLRAARATRYSHARRARLIGAVGSFTKAEWSALCALYGGRCLRCGDACRLTLDHIIPLSRGGSNAINNIQPLCLSCNSAKGTRTVDYRKVAP